MKKIKAQKGFFILDSVPGVQFLNGTSFKECRQHNGHLTLKEYNEANEIKEVKKVEKSEKINIVDKRLKIDLEDK